MDGAFLGRCPSASVEGHRPRAFCKRADTIIRECSQAVTVCMGFLPEPATSVRQYAGPHGRLADGRPACPVEGPHDHDEDRLWRSRRLFYWRTFDAATFDEWSAHRKERMRPVARQLFWRPGALAPRAYDTFDSVLSLGSVTDAGTCMDCGGHRLRSKCTCDKPAAGPRSRARHVIPETDDTPAVVVELPATA